MQNDHSNPYIESTTVLSDIIYNIYSLNYLLYTLLASLSLDRGKLHVFLFFNLCSNNRSQNEFSLR